MRDPDSSDLLRVVRGLLGIFRQSNAKLRFYFKGDPYPIHLGSTPDWEFSRSPNTLAGDRAFMKVTDSERCQRTQYRTDTGGGVCFTETGSASKTEMTTMPINGNDKEPSTSLPSLGVPMTNFTMISCTLSRRSHLPKCATMSRSIIEA